jgi:hypothetical protein
MLIEISKKDISHSINSFHNRTVIIICPNYEDRSITLIDEMLNEFDYQQVLFVIVELIGKAKVGILDERTLINRKKAIESLKLRRVNYKEMRLQYPTVELMDEVRNSLIQSISDVTVPINIVVDVSCMPSGFILSLFSFVDQENINHKTFHRVYIFYATPTSYPKVDHPQSIGAIRGHFNKQIELHILPREKPITLVVFPGREGFEGKQAHDFFSKFECEKHIMLMFYKDNPMLSLPTLWNNQLLISESKANDSNLEFYFTLEDGLRHLQNVYNKALTHSEALFIAPFGPKPLMIGAYQVIKKFIYEKEKLHERFLADLILLSSFQYTSTYSIGSDFFTFFEYKLDYLEHD